MLTGKAIALRNFLSSTASVVCELLKVIPVLRLLFILVVSSTVLHFSFLRRISKFLHLLQFIFCLH